MADNKHTPPPQDPWPLSPSNEEVVDSAHVTFAWEPVEGALEYRFQVARDSTFQQIILQEDLPGDKTSYGPASFQADDQTYYWRVVVRTDVGWSAGERVESFVAATREQASLNMARPDDDERMGPFPELVRSGSTEIKAEFTGRPEYYEEEEAEGVEHEGVETAQITILAGIVLVIIAGLIGIVVVLYNNVEQTTRRMVTGISGYPELTQLNQQAESMLSNYGIIDQENGIYQIPIEQAMELTVQQYSGRPESAYSSELPLTPAQQVRYGLPGGAAVSSDTSDVQNE